MVLFPDTVGRGGVRGSPGFAGRVILTIDMTLSYEKNWKIIEEGGEYLMMRFVDQGTLVGQVTLTPLPPQSEVLTLSDLENDIEATLGEQFGHLVSASTLSRDDGTTIMRVASVGEADNLPFHWIHYHLRTCWRPKAQHCFCRRITSFSTVF